MPAPAALAALLPFIVEAVKNAFPVFEDEVTAEVIGHPGANRKDLYYLAVATAMGLVRRFGPLPGVFPPVGMLMIEYDAADNWVRCTLRYETSALTLVGASGTSGGASRLGPTLAAMPIFNGPSPITTGSEWNFRGITIPGTVLPIAIPPLPFAGRTILTTDTTSTNTDPSSPSSRVPPANMNPHPPGDLRSRGSVVRGATLMAGTWNGDLVADLLIPLVYSALSNPGTPDQEVFPVPTAAGG